MSSRTSCFGAEDDVRAAELERGLRAFYSSVDKYEAFQGDNWKPEFWAPVRSVIEAYPSQYACKVLEVGAGKTGFTRYLGRLRDRVEFHAQDIVDRNGEYLTSVADKVWFCEVTDIRESYDVVLGTFVYEHMTRPRATLNHLLTLIRPGGSVFLASPRYDFPGYFGRSARHLPSATQLAIALHLTFRRLRVLLGGPPLFLIHFDPAVFHCPWFRDADAVHWPSLYDLKRELAGRAAVQQVRIRATGFRQQFWARFLLLFVQIECVKSTTAQTR